MRAGYRGSGALAAIATLLSGCGGSSSGTASTPSTAPTPVTNSLAATVDGGSPAIVQADGIVPNILYVSVTVCAPGSTSNCQTIDHVQIDTQSEGLRVMGSVLDSALLAALPRSTTSGGLPVFECDPFGDGYSWGPMTSADIQFTSDEQARSVPIQIIQDPTSVDIPAVRSDCQSNAGEDYAENTPATFGANGLLGVGAFLQDCGPACVSGTQVASYYSCTSATSTGSCSDITMSLADQAQNPVAVLSSTDRNGIQIQLPIVTAPGQVSVAGTLYFGVGTQTNNTLGSATVYPVAFDTDSVLDTQYAGTDLPYSFLDAGSNGYYFNSALLQCADLAGFYCPASTASLSATIQGETAEGSPTGSQETVDFDIGNADALLPSNLTNAALPTLGGTGTSGSFDWGLPFFYGRTISVVFESQTAAGSTQIGPYMAF